MRSTDGYRRACHGAAPLFMVEVGLRAEGAAGTMPDAGICGEGTR